MDLRKTLFEIAWLTDEQDEVKEGDEPKNMSEALDMIEKRGIEQGIEQGMKTINMLYARLLKDGRIKDLERSVSDSAYQEQLLAEFFHELSGEK